jgi:16S rRNA (cytosine1402-N4)-methyltransferase
VAHGILFDLGVSSLQLDEPTAVSPTGTTRPWTCGWTSRPGITAAEVLNTYSHGDLARILKTYGEERFAGRIASAVVREREKEPFTTSARLVEVLRAAVPAASQRSGGHPAKRTFQALRIEVNAELAVWERAIAAAIDVLRRAGGSRCCPTTRWRTASPSRRLPAAPQPHPGRDAGRAARARAPTCGC